MPTFAIVVAVLLAAVSADVASARTAGLVVTDQNGERAARVVYRSDPGERNVVGIRPDWSEDGSSFLWFPGDSAPGPPTAVVVSDGRPDPPGAGCQRAGGDNSDSLWCAIPAGARSIGPQVYLGDRNDMAEIEKGSSRWPGDTAVFGGLGHDRIAAGAGLLVGGPGGDTIRGGDHVLGGAGRDLIDAGPGGDEITPGSDVDEVEAGSGGDVIRARDGRRDYIDCGPGQDAVRADGIDFVDWSRYGGSELSCERIRRSSPARAIPESIWAYEGDSVIMFDIVCPYDGPRRCSGRFELRIGGRILGPARFSMRRGDIDEWEYELGWRAIERLDGKYGRAIVRTFDARGVLRTASLTLRLYLDTPACGDC
jgi:hypothetical protein